MYKKVVLGNANPDTEISINDLQMSGWITFCVHQNNVVCGMIGASWGGLVIYNMEKPQTGHLLSPHDPNESPTVEYSTMEEAILSNLDGYTWYQAPNMGAFCKAYLELCR